MSLGALLTFRVLASYIGFIKGEHGNQRPLLPFDDEASATLPIDFGVIERRYSRPGGNSLVFGETPPRLEPCRPLALCTENGRDAEVAGVPDEFDYVEVWSGRV